MFATHQQPIGAPTMNFGSYEHFSAHGPDTSKATASQGLGFSDPSTVAAAAALYMQQQQQQQPMGPQHQAALQLLQQNAMLMASNPVAMAAAAAALQQQQQQQLPHQQHLAALSGLLANQFTATSHHGGHAKPAAGTLPMPTQNFTMPFGQPPQQPPLSLAPLAGAPTSVYGGMQHQLQSLSAAASTATPFGGHFTPQMPQLSSQYGASSLLPTPQQQPQQFQYQQPQLQQQQMMHQQQPQSRTGAAPPPYGAGAGAPRHSSRGGPMTHTLNVSSSGVSASASNGSGSMTGASVPPPGTMGPNNSTVALAAYADPLSRLRRVAASVDHLGEASDEVHGRATLYEDYRTADSVPVEGAPPGRPSWKRTVEFVQVVVAQVSGPACREPAAVMDLLAQALLRCGMLRREDIWFLDTPRVNFKDGRTTGLMSVKVSPAAARVLLFLSRDSVAEPTPHVAAAHDLPIETACDAPHIAAMRGGENSGNGAGSMPLSLAIAHPRPRILFVSGFSVLLSLTPAGVEQLLTLETHHQARQQQHLPRSGVTFALPWRLCVQRYQSINAYVLPPLDPATGLPVAPTPSASATTTATGATAVAAAAALPMPPLVTDSSLIFKQQDQSQITSAPSVLSMPRGDSPTSSRNSYPM